MEYKSDFPAAEGGKLFIRSMMDIGSVIGYRPGSGESRPLMMCRRVLFPLPDGPMMEIKSPLCISMLAGFSAVTRFSAVP